MTPYKRFCLVLLALAQMCVGCTVHDQLHIRYIVHAMPSKVHPAPVLVEMRLENVQGDSLVLDGLSESGICRFDHVEAVDGERTLTTYLTTFSSRDGPSVTVPRVVVKGPFSRLTTIRYVAWVGIREGSEHRGFTGRCFGLIDSAIAVIPGRLALLTPSLPRAGTVELLCHIPRGWTALPPLQLNRRYFSLRWPALNLREQAAGAILTVGLLHRLSRSSSGPTIVLPAALGDSAVAAARGPIAKLLQVLFEECPWAVDTSATIVALPVTSDGDDVATGLSSSVQAMTLLPATESRLRQCAEQLLLATLTLGTRTHHVRKSQDNWVVEGCTHLIARRCAALAFSGTTERADQALAIEYVSSLKHPTGIRDLEEMYKDGRPSYTLTSLRAPAALLMIEERARAGGQQNPLRSALTRQFIGPTSSLRDAFQLSPTAWHDIRNRLQDRIPLDLDELRDTTHFAPIDSAGGWPRSARLDHNTILLCFTGNQDGYLENCGCKSNQSGGVARRATFFREMRRVGLPLLLIDAGNAVANIDKEGITDSLSRLERRIAVQEMVSAGFSAACLGEAELTQFDNGYAEDVAAASLPLLNANVLKRGSPIAAPFRELEVGGHHLGIISVLAKPSAQHGLRHSEEAMLNFTVLDPIASAAGLARKIRDRVELVIVAGSLSPSDIRQLLRASSDVDVVISTRPTTGLVLPRGSTWSVITQSLSGWSGKTLVLFCNLTRYGVNWAELGLARGKGIANARVGGTFLDDRFTEAPDVRGRLTQFYHTASSRLSVRNAASAPYPEQGSQAASLVGAGRCRGCHETEFVQWFGTQHALAYKTLLDRHRQYQPRCVACHVVGLGRSDGFRMESAEGRLAGVQCEVCHGAGSEHIEHAGSGFIARRPSATLCLGCHDEEHSSRQIDAAAFATVGHKPSMAQAR